MPLDPPGSPPHADAAVRDGITVIIPAYEDCERLRRACWSVRTTADLPYELIVARAPQCVARNRNAGLARAATDLVAFVDDDVLLPAGWMTRLAAPLLRNPAIGAVSAWLRFPSGAPQMRRQDLQPGELWDAVPPGTCFVYARARLDDLGFDQGYLGSQWEDTDWMWQVRARGLRTVVCGGVEVVHEHVLRYNDAAAENQQRFVDRWGRLPGDESAVLDPAELARWRPEPL